MQPFNGGATRLSRRAGLALGLTVLMASLTSTGCGPRWEVIRSGPREAFVKQSRFAALPLDFTNMRVGANGEKSENQYLADKDADDRAEFIASKGEMSREFLIALSDEARERNIEIFPAVGPAAAPFVLRPLVRKIEPGYYAVFASAPSEVEVVLLITDLRGVIFDEVIFRNKTQVSAFNASQASRFTSDARGIGTQIAEYLQERTARP